MSQFEMHMPRHTQVIFTYSCHRVASSSNTMLIIEGIGNHFHPSRFWQGRLLIMFYVAVHFVELGCLVNCVGCLAVSRQVFGKSAACPSWAHAQGSYSVLFSASATRTLSELEEVNWKTNQTVKYFTKGL